MAEPLDNTQMAAASPAAVLMANNCVDECVSTNSDGSRVASQNVAIHISNIQEDLEGTYAVRTVKEEGVRLMA